ncbi:MAG: exodeoxyribonuclease VII large subunit [Bacteroidetes bacterium]|nr:exodeoxyribonuclease VII large subunit [Bacteroidota bacterium]
MSITQPIRLSQLTSSISETLNRKFSSLSFWVIADVTSHTFRPDKNYHSLDLVEKDPASNALIAKIPAKAWGKGSTSITNFEILTGQRFTNNINVLVNVSIDYHPVYGLQLNINQIDSNFTLGMLEQQRQATLARLIKENPEFIRKQGDNYLTKNKELPLSRVIQKIAIISSKTSAGWQDFRHTLDNNPFGYYFDVDDYFTVVQGENNAQQFLTRLIDVFNSARLYDAVVIIRGGGAQTDFLIFDDYMIGKAIAKFPFPVITGIGHQKNETIADLMAHTQTKTPTKAAEFIINHNRNFEDNVTRLRQQIIIRTQQTIAGKLKTLNQINNVIVNQSHSLLSHRKEMLMTTKASIKILCNNYTKNQSGYLSHFASMIRIASPEETLKRGFAIIKANDRITSNPDDIHPGEEIRIILASTEFNASITSKKDYHGTDFNL